MMFWPTSFYGFRSIVCIIGIILIAYLAKKLINRKTKGLLVAYITFMIICDSFILDGLKTFLAVTTAYTLGGLIYCLKDNYKMLLLTDITKWFSYMMWGCIIAYIIWLIAGYPHVNILQKPYGYTDFYNYLFFIRPTAFMLFPRFSGPFMEPGHLGMISVFFLYANRFDFKNKKYLWALVVSIIFSLSLAGYVLLVLALILNSKHSIKSLLLIFLSGYVVFIVATKGWNSGNNPINTTIIERLQFDEEKGISGNNRNFNYTDHYFSQMCNDGTIITGIGFDGFMKGLEEGKIGGAGIIVFLMQYGIIGTIFVVCYYFAIAIYGFDKKFAIGYFLLILFCFLQRAYPTWMAWLLPYISSITIYQGNKQNGCEKLSQKSVSA